MLLQSGISKRVYHQQHPSSLNKIYSPSRAVILLVIAVIGIAILRIPDTIRKERIIQGVCDPTIRRRDGMLHRAVFTLAVAGLANQASPGGDMSNSLAAWALKVANDLCAVSDIWRCCLREDNQVQDSGVGTPERRHTGPHICPSRLFRIRPAIPSSCGDNVSSRPS